MDILTLDETVFEGDTSLLEGDVQDANDEEEVDEVHAAEHWFGEVEHGAKPARSFCTFHLAREHGVRHADAHADELQHRGYVAEHAIESERAGYDAFEVGDRARGEDVRICRSTQAVLVLMDPGFFRVDERRRDLTVLGLPGPAMGHLV